MDLPGGKPPKFAQKVMAFWICMVIFLSQIGLYSTLRQAIAPLSRKFSLATIRGSMSTLGSLDFVDLEVPRAQLHPELTLIMGQCFAWQRLTKDKDLPMWVAVLEGCPVVIKQDKAMERMKRTT